MMKSVMAIKRLRDEEDEAEIQSLRTANYLILLSRGDDYGRDQKVESVGHSAGRVFECKTCNRQFGSFQALGGHRASHKKPRTIEDLDKQTLPVKPKVHECPICGLEFPIGQALGGHMRRHRNALPMVKKSHLTQKKKAFCMDLNSLPSEDEQPELFFGLGLVPNFSTVH